MHRVKFKAKNGTTYIYEGTTVWDEESKKYKTKRICIGKLDPESGELIPSKRLDMTEKIARDINKNNLGVMHAGHDMLLWSITQRINLDRIMKSAIPSDWRAVLAMVWYLVVESAPLSSCGNWMAFNQTPFVGKFSSRYIVEVLIDCLRKSRLNSTDYGTILWPILPKCCMISVPCPATIPVIPPLLGE